MTHWAHDVMIQQGRQGRGQGSCLPCTLGPRESQVLRGLPRGDLRLAWPSPSSSLMRTSGKKDRHSGALSLVSLEEETEGDCVRESMSLAAPSSPR